MKNLLAAAFFSCALASAPAQTSVGVSIGINQPGVYGRIDIGNFQPPQVVYAQPVIITPPSVVVQQPPVYMYVPPGHQKHWAKHCARYNACGQPVYFVQESWVRERYNQSHGREDHDEGGGKGHGRGKKDKD